MLKRLKIELNFEKIIDNVLEETIKKGLNDDKENILNEYGREAFGEMQRDYRRYGALYAINFKKNLENEFKKFINNIEED